MKLNNVTKKLPKYLHKFIVKQPYEEYTAQNQAVWRYVMRLNMSSLKKVAHSCYIDGLNKTGIVEDFIPEMEGMNRILKNIGWAAVSVDGFIPPNAFMEFQSYNVLVISSEIRTIDHIKYTPAPDIIHEAAGHAPIIANQEYSEYLRRLGEIGCKAISSPKDDEMYEAVRLLSILKENPNSSKKDIEEANNSVNRLQNEMGELSEMAKIRNLHWWTVEYGLIGDLNNPKIYGAGLLSSIEESQACLEKKVRKIPYSIDAANVNFDITNTQPQLFVVPDFSKLSFVLEKFANTMAIRTGGLNGVRKLIDSKTMGSVELSSGVQVSGHFTNVIQKNKKTIYFNTSGETAISVNGKELIGHGKEYHKVGFGSPVGKLEGINIAIENMSPKDLKRNGIVEGKKVILNFEGGIKVEGEIITGKRDLQGKIILISFKDCRVTYLEKVLFDPSWGVYDMAVGENITSAFAGPASTDSFSDIYSISDKKTNKIIYSKADQEIHKLYKSLRVFRENKTFDSKVYTDLFKEIKENCPDEWLILLELYEVVYFNDITLAKEVHIELVRLKRNKNLKQLICDGLDLIKKH
ncbi:MAG: aromatic amino acid hydroxylase [Flavobacteriaceae bacterium]|nr:aromatic amino acid hydroxylase [Flavobacteriaceae bacterium]